MRNPFYVLANKLPVFGKTVAEQEKIDARYCWAMDTGEDFADFLLHHFNFNFKD
tara:strand:+ start:92 stop:253 length:162 start_codon:yes stop_codon:yes gene_type:complete